MRERLEVAFAHWGRIVYRRAWIVIVLVLALVAGLASQLPNLSYDTSTEGFFPKGDPVRDSYDRFRAQFGQDTLILVAVKPDDVFALDTLERLRALHEEIENEVPLLVDVTSLVNARQTVGVGDELVVGDFLEEWPRTQEDAERARAQALANPLYLNNLVSPDGSFTTIVLKTETYSRVGNETEELAGFDDEDPEPAAAGSTAFLTGEETSEIVTALLQVVKRHRAGDFEIYVSGNPVYLDQFQAAMKRDMSRFATLAVLMIGVLLAALFRRLAGVVLPLATVLLSVTTTMSIMVITGTPLTLPTQILPTFLLAVGVGSSVHILAIFYQARRRGEGREDSIAYALGHSGLAVLMTSLTTAGGLLSFTAAVMRPIAHFGYFGPAGVMIALVFTVVLLPALIAVFPMREEDVAATRDTSVSQRMLLRVGDFATRRAGPMVACWALLLVVAVAGATRTHLSHDPVGWWPEGHPMRVATEVINEELAGAMFFEALVQTGGENGMHDPALLQGLRDLAVAAQEIDVDPVYTGKVLSLADIVAEIHMALNENRPEFRAIPTDRDLVAQELLLFENAGSDDLEDFVDPTFRTGRITFKVPFVDATRYPEYVGELKRRSDALLPGVEVEYTGMGNLMTSMVNAVMLTLARSYVLALIFVMPLLVILIGNLRMGLTAIIPNLTPIVCALGLMGWLGIGIDTFTLLIGCIAIGLAVDDTIHFMHNFRRYYEDTGDVRLAVRKTLETTGQALLFTSLVLSMGFLLYTQAEMTVLFSFGFLTAFTIMMAFLADVLLAPALLVLVTRPSEATSPQALEMEASS